MYATRSSHTIVHGITVCSHVDKIRLRLSQSIGVTLHDRGSARIGTGGSQVGTTVSISVEASKSIESDAFWIALNTFAGL